MIHPNVRSSIEMRLIFDGIHDVTDDQLKFSQQVGVEGIAVAAPELGDPDLGHYAFADLIALRTRIEAYGLNLEGIENSPWVWTYKWMLGLPGRDEQIENYQKTIRNLGAAGIPVITFNMHAMRFYRTAWSKPVRGGAGATAFDWELVKDAPLMTGGPSIDTGLIPQSHWRPIGDEEMWDNLTYFLKAAVPVAEETGVKLGLHPDDPPIPSIGGVARIMRSPDAFRRAIETEEIRYFGSRKKIFHVHFRNVAGTADNFNETFPDEGETDMVEAMKAYVEVGYDGTMAPDHVIRMAGDSDWGHRYWAYAIGHMKALKRAVEKMS
jgi:mannonate dehydratase